jgi:hypothetical protein
VDFVVDLSREWICIDFLFRVGAVVKLGVVCFCVLPIFPIYTVKIPIFIDMVYLFPKSPQITQVYKYVYTTK